MNQGTTVGVAAVVGLVAGIVVGRATAPRPLLDCATLQNRTIRISANGMPDCATATIGNLHQITWVAPTGMKVAIAFGQPNPFPALDNPGTNTSDSGPVGPGVFAPGEPIGTKKTFTYTVSLNGGTPQPNGRIIIQKQK